MSEYSISNQHGVYQPCETISGAKGRWAVHIDLAHPGENDWRYAVKISLSHRGHSGPITIHTRAYPSRDQAFFAGLDNVRVDLQHYLQAWDLYEIEKDEIRQALIWVDMQKQLKLF